MTQREQPETPEIGLNPGEPRERRSRGGAGKKISVMESCFSFTTVDSNTLGCNKIEILNYTIGFNI